MKCLLACLLFAGSSGVLFAQDAPEIIRLHVSPNPPPLPALRLSLLPEIADLKPGNAAFLYYRSFSPEWWGAMQRQPVEFWTRIDEARTLPLDKLKKGELQLPGGLLKEVDRAARREYCDWELSRRIEEDG